MAWSRSIPGVGSRGLALGMCVHLVARAWLRAVCLSPGARVRLRVWMWVGPVLGSRVGPVMGLAVGSVAQDRVSSRDVFSGCGVVDTAVPGFRQ